MKRVVAAVASVILVAVLTGATAAPGASAPPQAPAGPVAEDPTDSVRAAEYWLDQYGVREAWETTRGAGPKNAIIGTRVGQGPSEVHVDQVLGLAAS